MIGVLAAVLLSAWAVFEFWLERAGGSRFTSAAAGRIGLVFAAICLAWPSLRRPLQWLPPGIPVLLIVGIAVVAARPRLIIAILPMLGLLWMLATLIRALKGKV